MPLKNTLIVALEEANLALDVAHVKLDKHGLFIDDSVLDVVAKQNLKTTSDNSITSITEESFDNITKSESRQIESLMLKVATSNPEAIIIKEEVVATTSKNNKKKIK